MASKSITEISFYLASPWIYARDMDNFLWSQLTDQQQGS
jgi:hypothetical protein